jgi:hypothetical protein
MKIKLQNLRLYSCKSALNTVSRDKIAFGYGCDLHIADPDPTMPPGGLGDNDVVREGGFMARRGNEACLPDESGDPPLITTSPASLRRTVVQDRDEIPRERFPRLRRLLSRISPF